MQTIIETTSNQFFSVTSAGPGLDHVWEGVEVKKVKGDWVPKAKARPTLVRKAATRLIAAAHS